MSDNNTNKTSISATVSPSNHKWNWVRIFWSNEEPKDFKKTYQLPRIDTPSDSTSGEVLELKRKNIRINPYETNESFAEGKTGAKLMTDLLEKNNNDLKQTLNEARKITKEEVFFNPALDTNPDGYQDQISKDKYKENEQNGKKVLMSRKAKIANAVSQNILVKISLTSNVTSAADLPNIETWAFLQPPTIGKNKFRVAVNNGFVVDDAPKAGWFKGKILGTEATAHGNGLWETTLKFERYKIEESKNKKSEFEIESVEVPAWIKVDPSDSSLVTIKYKVTVRNDCTLQDLEERREFLRKEGKPESTLTAECGSFMKIWARNLDFQWNDEGPKDEYTDQFMVDMQSKDTQLDANNPQKFKNHTWRRDKLSSAENPNDLLYVGLYPANIINSVHELETKLNNQPDLGGEHPNIEDDSTNFGVWFGITVIYSLFVYGMYKFKGKSAEQYHKWKPQKSVKVHESELGANYKKFLDLFGVAEIMAAYAVVGVRSNLGFSDTLKAAKSANFEKLSNFTSYFYDQMISFALESNDYDKQKHLKKVEKENDEIKARIDQLDSKKSFAKNIKSQTKFEPTPLKDWIKEMKKGASRDADSAGVKTEFDLATLGTAIKMPYPKGQPLPIPFLQWLIWSVTFKAEGTISLELDAEYKNDEKTKEESASLGVTFGAKSNASMTFSLQAIWGAFIDDQANGFRETDQRHATGINEFKWGKMLQDLFKAVDVNVFIGIALNSTAKIGPKFNYDFVKEKFSTELGEASGGLDFKAPMGCQLAIFNWEYDLASADLIKVSKSEATFFSELKLLEKTWRKPQVINWGVASFYRFIEITNYKKQYSLGEPIEAYLLYNGMDKPDIDPKLQFLGGSNNGKEIGSLSSKSVVYESKVVNRSKDYKSKQIAKLNFNISLYSEEDDTLSLFTKAGLCNPKEKDFIKLIGDKEGDFSLTFKPKDSNTRHLDPDFELKITPPKIEKVVAHEIRKVGNAYIATFKIEIDNFQDKHIWVRFWEQDNYGIDDKLKFKASESRKYAHWNLVRLRHNSGKNFYLDVNLANFESYGTEMVWDDGLSIYPEFALAVEEDEAFIELPLDSSKIQAAKVSDKVLEKL